MPILYYHVDPNNSWTFSTTPIYDKDRYELVEKKEWKVNNLKEQIRQEENIKTSCMEQIRGLLLTMKHSKDVIENLNKELEELEKE